MINRVIKVISIYLKVVIKGQRYLQGYKYREIGNVPMLDCRHFDGYEIMNPQTNKIIYRKVRYCDYIRASHNNYRTVIKFFPKNIK